MGSYTTLQAHQEEKLQLNEQYERDLTAERQAKQEYDARAKNLEDALKVLTLSCICWLSCN